MCLTICESGDVIFWSATMGKSIGRREKKKGGFDSIFVGKVWKSTTAALVSTRITRRKIKRESLIACSENCRKRIEKLFFNVVGRVFLGRVWSRVAASAQLDRRSVQCERHQLRRRFCCSVFCRLLFKIARSWFEEVTRRNLFFIPSSSLTGIFAGQLFSCAVVRFDNESVTTCQKSPPWAQGPGCVSGDGQTPAICIGCPSGTTLVYDHCKQLETADRVVQLSKLQARMRMFANEKLIDDLSNLRSARIYLYKVCSYVCLSVCV
jgi:hypothetical protein